MNRRGFLFSAAGSAVAFSTFLRPGISFADANSRQEMIESWRRRIQSILDKKSLPIIDMEATYVPGKTHIGKIVQWMDEVGVAQIAFAPAFSPDGQPSLDLQSKYPGYFIPTTNSGEFPRWPDDPLAFLEVVKGDLKTGNYFLMGEHEFRHYPSPEQVKAGRTDRDITIPLDGPAGQALFQLSEETGVAFQIHYEIEDRLLPVLEQMLTRYPKAKVIWCHLAMIRYPDRAKTYTPDYVSSLIERFPGLHFDLAMPPPQEVYGPSGVHDATLYKDGHLDDRWKAVLEKYPDRFVAASDYRPPIEQMYTNNMQRQRNLILAELNEEARHKIAFGNAWRLVTGESWSGRI